MGVMKIQLVTAAAVVLVGGGVALGLALSGGSTSPTPAHVVQVDQPVVGVTSNASSAAATPTDTVPSSVAAALTPTRTVAKAAPTSTQTPTVADTQHIAGVIGSDGALHPGGTASPTFTPCQTPQGIPDGKGGFSNAPVANPCPH